MSQVLADKAPVDQEPQKLFVCYWNDGYQGGPAVLLKELAEIEEFEGIKPLHLASIRTMECDTTYTVYGVLEVFKVWRVE